MSSAKASIGARRRISDSPLIISPVVGFTCAALLLLLAKVMIKPRPELFAAPEKNKAPPLWIRSLLVLTCTGVSFAHGSNDGQKGMGLLMLIMIGVVPGAFALNMSTDEAAIRRISAESQSITAALQTSAAATAQPADPVAEVSSYLGEGSKRAVIPYSAMAELNHQTHRASSRAGKPENLFPDCPEPTVA